MSEPRIAFIASGGYHFSPGVKPFLALAQALPSLGINCKLFAYSCGLNALETIHQRLKPEGVACVERESELEREIERFKPTFLVSDDAPDRLRIVSTLRKKTRAQTVTYIHILFGLHSLKPLASQSSLGVWQRLQLAAARRIPFSTLTLRYRNRLRKTDFRIANSGFTEMVVGMLYGLPSNGIVYPPIDTNVFQPKSLPPAKKSGVLVFLGDVLDRPPEEYMEILSELQSVGETLHLIGDPWAIKQSKSALKPSKLVIHSNLTDMELAAVYQRAKVTFIPQDWEDFGNVGPESILSGTPAVLCQSQPWMEIVGHTAAARVIRDSSRTASAIRDAVTVRPEDIAPTRKVLVANLSIPVVAARFAHVLGLNSVSAG